MPNSLVNQFDGKFKLLQVAAKSDFVDFWCK